MMPRRGNYLVLSEFILKKMALAAGLGWGFIRSGYDGSVVWPLGFENVRRGAFINHHSISNCPPFHPSTDNNTTKRYRVVVIKRSHDTSLSCNHTFVSRLYL